MLIRMRMERGRGWRTLEAESGVMMRARIPLLG
jgi:hypothetical protein